MCVGRWAVVGVCLLCFAVEWVCGGGGGGGGGRKIRKSRRRRPSDRDSAPLPVDNGRDLRVTRGPGGPGTPTAGSAARRSGG